MFVGRDVLLLHGPGTPNGKPAMHEKERKKKENAKEEYAWKGTHWQHIERHSEWSPSPWKVAGNRILLYYFVNIRLYTFQTAQSENTEHTQMMCATQA